MLIYFGVSGGGGRIPGHSGAARKPRAAFDNVDFNPKIGHKKDQLNDRFSFTKKDAIQERKELSKYVFRWEHLALLMTIIVIFIYVMSWMID